MREARAAFLAAAGAGERDRILADLGEADAALMAALDGGAETVLWFEHDLHDQLQLIQILARIAPHPGRDAVRLITLDRHPGHPRFAGLGELSAAELAELWPRRAPVAADAFATAAGAYAALQGPDAFALASLAHATHAGLPYLAAALRRLLEERPWTAAELGRSERQILRAVAAGATTPAEVFTATWAMEEAPYAGDTWIFRRIGELARRDPPLVTAGDRLALTPAGRSALGRSD